MALSHRSDQIGAIQDGPWARDGRKGWEITGSLDGQEPDLQAWTALSKPRDTAVRSPELRLHDRRAVCASSTGNHGWGSTRLACSANWPQYGHLALRWGGLGGRQRWAAFRGCRCESIRADGCARGEWPAARKHPLHAQSRRDTMDIRRGVG